MSKKLILATKAFMNFNNKILILRESLKSGNSFNPGKYDIVGGQVEPGKPLFECLRENIRVDTGLEVEIRKPFFVNEWLPENSVEKWHAVGIFFECFPKTDKVKLASIYDDFLWIDPMDYSQYYLFKELRPAFEYYLKK